MEYKKRPSMIRSNARFRGPTETIKYGNTVNETLHDIKLLGKWIDRDEFIFSLTRGQTDFIRDNFAAYFSGDKVTITSSTSTAADLFRQGEAVLPDIKLSDSRWVVYGGCVKGTTSTGYSLYSPGTSSPSGVQTTINVQEGQILYLRMKATGSQGSPLGFTIGSRNVNQGEGILVEQVLDDGDYYGVYITCLHKEDITINIDLYTTGSNLPEVKIDFSDISLTYVERNPYHLQPINSSIKSQINILDEEIQNIIDNL
jgi:hypothetical protein